MNRREFHKDFLTINRRYERKYQPLVKDALIPDGLIPAIEKGGAKAGRAFLHQTVHNPKLGNVIKQLYADVGVKHAASNYRRMTSETRGAKKNFAETIILKSFEQKLTIGFNAEWTRIILSFLQRFLLEKITFEVATTTRDKLLEILNESITEGLSVDETVARIRDLPFTESQAARIVRTEVNRAANVGARAQSQTFAFEQLKEWISAEDDRVRGTSPKDHASHVALDGQNINEDDLFKDTRNGDLLEFPGDPRASAESTINCRCSVAYTAKRDMNGRLIPKRQSTVVVFPNQIRQRQTVVI